MDEFDLGIGGFVQLHGDMPVRQITRRRIRAFREALQDIPTRRTGTLRTAPQMAPKNGQNRTSRLTKQVDMKRIMLRGPYGHKSPR